jgi:hypothetical protein
MSGIGPIEMIVIICILAFFGFVAIVILAALLLRPRAAGAGSGSMLPDENRLNKGDAAGGDLTGAYPAPQVAGLQGQPVSSAPPANGQVLVWDQTAGQWEPRDLPGVDTQPD